MDGVVEAPPPAVGTVFGAQLPRAERFVDLLVGPGVERGLLGPREAARIWSRHVLNCAVLAELLPATARVVDVGSGAGLPGLAVAIARPELRVDLVEPLLRRAEFLAEAVASLELGDRVRVIRGRAEEPGVLRAVGQADWVTARAVAPLDRLVRWCLPLAARRRAAGAHQGIEREQGSAHIPLRAAAPGCRSGRGDAVWSRSYRTCCDGSDR